MVNKKKPENGQVWLKCKPGSWVQSVRLTNSTGFSPV